MQSWKIILPLVVGLAVAGQALAQAPADAPAGSTGLCKDGSYTSAAHKKGACHGHKGVQTWYAADSAAAASTASAPAAAPAPAAPAPTPAPAPTRAAAPASTAAAAPAAVAPGGGAGLVWLNTKSNVYHCQGDHDYGTTKQGQYLSEADAKAKGGRPARGKTCS